MVFCGWKRPVSWVMALRIKLNLRILEFRICFHSVSAYLINIRHISLSQFFVWRLSMLFITFIHYVTNKPTMSTNGPFIVHSSILFLISLIVIVHWLLLCFKNFICIKSDWLVLLYIYSSSDAYVESPRQTPYLKVAMVP